MPALSSTSSARSLLEPLDVLLRGLPSVTRVRVVIAGRVQGVWFRDSCREIARAEGVSGWVRNRGDGSVEAEFEGPPPAVDRVVAWCRQGPPRARVDNVETTSIAPVGASGFQVR